MWEKNLKIKLKIILILFIPTSIFAKECLKRDTKTNVKMKDNFYKNLQKDSFYSFLNILVNKLLWSWVVKILL